MQKSLSKAQTSLLNKANKLRKEVLYDIRDKVWLFIKNISIKPASKKLDNKIIEFFATVEKNSISMKL